jgi:DNA-binding transcriptional ArsR family regulator
VSDWDLDLLGDPIPEGFGRRGRPPHMPTLENRRKVMLLAAFDRNEEQIAAALSITPPTLRKHYFRELRSRLEARQRLEGKMLMALLGQVEAGNVSAIDKLYKRLDKHDLVLLGERVSDRGDQQPKAHAEARQEGTAAPGRRQGGREVRAAAGAAA